MGRKHDDRSKQLLSLKRKEWLKNNPDKHPWRNKDKFKSVPCEKVKEFLKTLNIKFIAEYIPDIEGRSFSIDIAMPDKMIAIEINGNQHYERDGTLKPYYQDRHNLLEHNGWEVYEIHYSSCFNLEKWSEFIDKLKTSNIKVEFDYFNYIPKSVQSWNCLDCGCVVTRESKRCRTCNNKFRNSGVKIIRTPRIRKIYKCQYCGITVSKNNTRCMPCSKKYREKSPKKISKCLCGNEKHHNAKKCMKCFNESTRVVKRPTKEHLEHLILEHPLTKIGEFYNVSDNAVRKWCKSYGITKFPDNKYRQKKFWESNGVSSPDRTGDRNLEDSCYIHLTKETL